jgi:hypothetical protein
MPKIFVQQPNCFGQQQIFFLVIGSMAIVDRMINYFFG